MRPLVQLQQAGVTFDRIPCDSSGNLCLSKAESLLRPQTWTYIYSGFCTDSRSSSNRYGADADRRADMSRAAYELDSQYGIMTRVGLHCAPNAHKTLGTYPAGTIRFSFGPVNTTEELEDTALSALRDLYSRAI